MFKVSDSAGDGLLNEGGEEGCKRNLLFDFFVAGDRVSKLAV